MEQRATAGGVVPDRAAPESILRPPLPPATEGEAAAAAGSTSSRPQGRENGTHGGASGGDARDDRRDSRGKKRHRNRRPAEGPSSPTTQTAQPGAPVLSPSPAAAAAALPPDQPPPTSRVRTRGGPLAPCPPPPDALPSRPLPYRIVTRPRGHGGLSGDRATSSRVVVSDRVRAEEDPPTHPEAGDGRGTVEDAADPGAERDPHEHRWGPNPYREVPDSRAAIASRHEHRNSLPAKADVSARGATLETLLLLLECSHAQLSREREASVSTTTTPPPRQEQPRRKLSPAPEPGARGSKRPRVEPERQRDPMIPRENRASQ